MASSVPVVPYSQIRNSLMSGDVITFQGRSKEKMDWAIQMVEGQPYTHVGLVVRDGSNLFYWDAPGGGTQFPDPYRNNQNHAGCRVADLDALLRYYMTEEVAMYLRRIQPALTAAQNAALRIFINAADGLPFPGQDLKWPERLGLGAGLGASCAIGNEFKATIAGNFFCAHLAAESYMRMGLLPIAPFPSNSYTPADFNSDDPAKLPLVKPATLTPLVEVKFDL